MDYYRHKEQFDASQIAPRLYQGSAPPPGNELRQRGFDVLVLCAEEIQPSPVYFPSITVIHAPMDDGMFIPESVAHPAAMKVSRALHSGKRVLVTCAMGLNRSGLVTALSLWYALGLSGQACVEAVRAGRRGALFNSDFARYLKQLPARSTRRSKPYAQVDSQLRLRTA
jgi:protein-tyrosine phosphatase